MNGRSSLIDRLSTISSDCPKLIRAEVLDAMLDAVSAEMGMYGTCATDTRGQRYFTSAALRGHDQELIDWIAPIFERPALDAPWLPPNTDPREVNTFIRIKTFYPTQELHSTQIYQSLFTPMETGDQVRVVLFDGSHFLGWIGLIRRGLAERFWLSEERKLNGALGHIRAALAAADALESKTLDNGVFGVSTAEGVIEHASPSLNLWLNPERQSYLTHRIRSIDGGTAACGSEIFSGAEIRIVRLDGSSGVRYLITIDRASIMRLDPMNWLTPRQREVAEFAAVGATSDEIARTLEISPHTVRTHIKNIYERLGVSSRLELAEKVAE